MASSLRCSECDAEMDNAGGLRFEGDVIRNVCLCCSAGHPHKWEPFYITGGAVWECGYCHSQREGVGAMRMGLPFSAYAFPKG